MRVSRGASGRKVGLVIKTCNLNREFLAKQRSVIPDMQRISFKASKSPISTSTMINLNCNVPNQHNVKRNFIGLVAGLPVKDKNL